jgi:HEAT repeat protein
MGYGESVEPLLQSLINENTNVRWAVAEALGRIGHAQAAPPLVEALKFQDIHWIASKALRKIGSPAIDPLMGALKDELAPVRRTAARVLGQIGDRWAVPRLIPLIKDEDVRVRIAVIEALGLLGDTGAAEHLVNALIDTEWNVRLVAAEALDRLGIQPDATEMGAFYWLAKREWPECVKIGEPALVPLVVMLKDPDELARENAADSLGKIGDPRTVDPLIELLYDSVPEVRQMAATALGRIGDPRAIDPISEVLKDPYPIVRRAATQALIELGPDAIEPLVTVLEAPDEDLRQSVVKAMGKFGEPSVELLLPYLEHADSTVRASAAEALGTIGDHRAVRPLINLLTDEDDEVRKIAALSLGQIGDEEAIDPLVAAIKYAEADMRQAAARALEMLGWVPDRSAAGAAFWMTKGDWDRCYKMGEAAIEPLISALRSKDKSQRVLAAETLGRLFRSRKLDPLYKERVRYALENITDPFVDDAIEMMYEQ